MDLVDLYSDTQTRPTPPMRAVMAGAEVGDEQQRRDPTVTALCAEVAELLGHETALFLPTGTMCNLIGVAAHVAPGRRGRHGAPRSHPALGDRRHRCRRRARSSTRCAASGGSSRADDLAPALEPGNPYRPPPTLVCLEQTHNFGGGTVWPLDGYRAVVARPTTGASGSTSTAPG